MSTDHNQTIAASHQSFRWKAGAKSPPLKMIALDISGHLWTMLDSPKLSALRCLSSTTVAFLQVRHALLSLCPRLELNQIPVEQTNFNSKKISVISFESLSFYLYYGQPCGQVCPMPFALVLLKVSVPTTTFLTHILPRREHNHEKNRELGM